MPGRRQLLESHRREILPEVACIRIGSERAIGIRPDRHARIARHQRIPIVIREEVLIQEVRRLHQLHPRRCGLRGMLVQPPCVTSGGTLLEWQRAHCSANAFCRDPARPVARHVGSPAPGRLSGNKAGSHPENSPRSSCAPRSTANRRNPSALCSDRTDAARSDSSHRSLDGRGLRMPIKVSSRLMR